MSATVYGVQCAYLFPVHGHDTQSVRAEVRPKHLEKLDSLAGKVATVELGDGGRPDDLWQEGEQGSGGVGHTEVKEKEVHPRDLGVFGEDDHDDEEVTDKDKDSQAAEDGDLHSVIMRKDDRAVG